MNYIDVAIWAANKATWAIIDISAHLINEKAPRDILTNADLAAQEVIVDTIKAHYPDHDILAEEGADLKGSPYVWIVDPLDGTINYMSGLPLFCTSIALQCEGKTIAGIVKWGRLFTSDDENKVSKTENLFDAMIALDWPADKGARKRTMEIARAIVDNARTLRSFGSSALALCYVARGWLDGFIHVDLEPWDAAAGALIVRNAGGKVTDFAGNDWTITSRQLVASNGWLHDEILALIEKKGN